MDLVNTLPDVRYTGTQLLKAIIYANAYYYGVCMRGWARGDIPPQSKLTQGLETTRYLVPRDKIPGGQDKPVHLNRDRAQPRGPFGRKSFPVLS